MQTFAERFSTFVVTRRRGVLAAWALLIALAATGLPRLHVNNNHRLFFSADNPELLAFNALEDTFVKNDTLNFVVAPPDGRVFTPASLRIVAQLTERAWQIPYVSRVDSLTNFQATEGQRDDLVVRELVPDPAALDDAGAEDVRRRALAEPLLAGALVREDARVTAVNVVVQMPRRDEAAEVPEVVAAARALAREFETRHPGLRIYLSGVVMMNNAFAEAALHDAETLVPLAFAVVIVGVGLFGGGARGSLGCLAVVALACIVAMGTGGWLGYPISAATSAAPVVILTVAVANCVHILDAHGRYLAQGMLPQPALIAAVQGNLKPIFFASLTTVIGFLTFNFSEVPPFRQLGNLVAFGDIASYLLAITLFPALLAGTAAPPAARNPAPSRALAALAEFVIRRRRSLALGMGGVSLLLIACIPRNELNDVFVEYFDDSITFRRDTDFVVANLTGVYHFYYTLDSGAEEGINDPVFLREADAFVGWLRTQPEVRHVASYTDILKRLNRNLHGEDPAAYRLPETRELAAQYLLLYEMSLPYGLDLTNQIDVGRAAIKITVGMDTLSSRAAIDFNARAEAWLAAHAPHIAHAEGSGTALMFSHLGLRNIHSMLTGTAIALVLISGILVLMLRSLRLGVLSLVPNLLPLAAGFGLWGLLVGEIGLSLSVVASMTLGIIVDDTVHFLTKYRHARRALGQAPEDAVRHAFQVNGRAMAVTTAVLVAGFLVLSLSSFELNAGMGLLTAGVIALALVADLLLLSPLLLLLEKSRDA